MASTVRALLSGPLSDLLSGAPSKVAKVVAITLVTSGAIAGVTQFSAQAQTPDNQPPATAPGATRAVAQSDSPIGIAAGEALMRQAEGAISSQDYAQAATDLVAARKALNDVSTYYQNIAGVFVGVDSRVNRGLRDLAVKAAQVRDQASYQLAVVYRAQGSPDLAVPLLVEVLQSQQPTRPLGQQAYQQLYELGFVEVPYDAPGGRARSGSNEQEQPEAEPDAQPTEESTEAPTEESAGEAIEVPVEQPTEPPAE